jgi:hypothetical protein
MVSMTDSYGRILGFLDRNRYFFFQVALQLYLRGTPLSEFIMRTFLCYIG